MANIGRSVLATCTVWVAVDDANRENGCLRIIKGSHKDARLLKHETNPSKELTLNQELKKTEYDESKAVDLELKEVKFPFMMSFLCMDQNQIHPIKVGVA